MPLPVVSLPPFTWEQWSAINSLGLQLDQTLEQAQVGLMMGGEPTYISARDRTSPQWQYEALGTDKRRIGGELLRHLQTQLAHPGSLRHHGIGKLYPGESVPRWALGCFWRMDGVPLWRNPDLLASDSSAITQIWKAAETFIGELAQCLAVPEAAILPAYETGETTPQGFVLPLLTTQPEAEVQWQSCRWPCWAAGIPLLPGTALLGLRLPFNDLPPTETLLQEAHPGLETEPIRPSEIAPLAPDYSI